MTKGVTTVTTEIILKAGACGLDVRPVQLPYHRRSSGRSSITAGKILHTGWELLRLQRVMISWRRSKAAYRFPDADRDSSMSDQARSGQA